MNYVGVRWAKNCHPSDLFVTYFTSSQYVAEYIKEHGMPDIIEVRKEFHGEDRVAKAINIEGRMLVRLNAAKRDDYLNKRDGNGQWSDEITIKHRQATKDAMNDPIIKEKQIAAINQPSIKKKHLDACVAAQNRPEVKAQNSDRQTSAWAREEVREAHDRAINSQKYQDYLSTRVGHNAPKFDDTIRRWIHKDGTIEECTRYDLYTKYKFDPSHLSELIQGKRKSVFGWRLMDCPDELITLVHKDTGAVMNVYMFEFIRDVLLLKTKFPAQAVYRLRNGEPAFGWKLQSGLTLNA
jgi:hypothetical protein